MKHQINIKIRLPIGRSSVESYNEMNQSWEKCFLSECMNVEEEITTDIIEEFLEEKNEGCEVIFIDTFKATFTGFGGSSYELDIFPKQTIIDYAYFLDWRKMFEKMFSEHSSMSGYKTTAYLNISTLEIEIFGRLGNTSLQKDGHLIPLYTLSNPLDEGLTINDFLTDDEYNPDDFMDVSEIWDYISKLDDYNERLIDAYMYHFDTDRAITDITESITEKFMTYENN